MDPRLVRPLFELQAQPRETAVYWQQEPSLRQPLGSRFEPLQAAITQLTHDTIRASSVVENLNTLPLTLQYYTGGAQSIRGYNYKSIGPGRILTVASIELQHKVYGDWYVSTFFDAGNVANNLTTDFKRGAGVGIVWQSPIGAIELTYARALDDPGRPWRLQFTMGPEL